MTQRIQRHPYLALFDGPDANASTAKRLTSTTPLQALYLMNDPFAGRTAKAFAGRLLRESDTDDGRVTRSFRLAFGLRPTASEHETTRGYLRQARERLPKESADEVRVWESYARALLMSNELIYID